MTNQRKFKMCNIGQGTGSTHFDILVHHQNSVVFLSCCNTSNRIEKINNEMTRQNNFYSTNDHMYLNVGGQNYATIKKKDGKNGYSHLIAYKKDKISELNNDDTGASNELIEAYVYVYPGETIERKLYEKIYDNSNIPIKEEWMNYIITRLCSMNRLVPCRTSHIYDEEPFEVRFLNMSRLQLAGIVTEGLREGHITIAPNTETSFLMEEINGLDSYLNVFGDNLANQIQESFTPKFNPDTDSYTTHTEYYDDSCYYNGANLYPAQRNAIQSGVNHLNDNDVFMLIGEMGTGKTLMGSGIAYSHYGKNTGMTNLVMCPSHLVKKWKAEIERFVPNGRAYIITDISELRAIENKIFAPVKREHTYIILSKEQAKTSYEMMPAVNWSLSKDTFTCPCCGKALAKHAKEIGENGRPIDVKVKFTKTDMLAPYAYNTVCNMTIDTVTGKTEGGCGAKLWGPFNKLEPRLKWIKLGSDGWIQKIHVNDIITRLAHKAGRSRKESSLLRNASKAQLAIEAGEELKGVKAPRKYCLSKYIRERYKGKIDYFLADELHLYKGDTKQGQALADLIIASKKTIGLTGTLLNGYASGLFYLLFRTMPREMVLDGFTYGNENEFARKYGVIKKESSHTIGSFGTTRNGSPKEKELPGVSPVVFTKFLLDNAVFVSLADMSGGLPAYEEIPVSVEMDRELAEAYESLEEELRSNSGFRSEGGMKIMGAMLQTLSAFPDTPYGQDPVCHPDTGMVVVTPPELPEGLRNKENKLLEMVEEKIALGEKVLIYTEFTNKTDCQEKLCEMLTEAGYNTKILKSSTSAVEREEWIEKELAKGLQVLICNPKLVETGLDLLEFVNIIFYQVGYNIFTMRQASRRSWRLSQTRDIKVYFLYYEDTIQSKALSLMASKLQASMAIEGKFSEEGLRAMSDNQDLMTQIAGSVVNGIKETMSIELSSVEQSERTDIDENKVRVAKCILYLEDPVTYYFDFLVTPTTKTKNRMITSKTTMSDILSFKIHAFDLF